MYVDSMMRRFSSELSMMLDKRVAVKTVDGKTFTGLMAGFNASNLSVVLADAKDEEGTAYPRIVIYGHVIAHISLTQEPLDMEELAKRLEEVFPKMVKYYPEARLITVMDRIKVTEQGVEGSGLLADRVRTVYERFLKEWRERERRS